MSKDNSNSKSGGIGFCGLLTLLFVGLKLTGYIDWSWWWVLSPVWGAFVFAMAILIVAAVIVATLERK